MTCYLRPHHFVCLQSFQGHGYNSTYINVCQNMLVELQQSDMICFTQYDSMCHECSKIHNCDIEDVIQKDDVILYITQSRIDQLYQKDKVCGRLNSYIDIYGYWFCEPCRWVNFCDGHRNINKL